MATVEMTVNGVKHRAEVEDRVLLANFLRDTLHLTGTHVGCDTSQCGACTIHVDGRAVKSCTMLAVQANGATIVTIEGMKRSEVRRAMQVVVEQQLVMLSRWRDIHG